ncbi:MAG: hypothetical protein PHV17_08235 [Candidatus Omnitrophica bacterium]|nr:hypothetical protein [Candidatus Omnitrophota bacterium]
MENSSGFISKFLDKINVWVLKPEAPYQFLWGLYGLYLFIVAIYILEVCNEARAERNWFKGLLVFIYTILFHCLALGLSVLPLYLIPQSSISVFIKEIYQEHSLLCLVWYALPIAIAFIALIVGSIANAFRAVRGKAKREKRFRNVEKNSPVKIKEVKQKKDKKLFGVAAIGIFNLLISGLAIVYAFLLVRPDLPGILAFDTAVLRAMAVYLTAGFVFILFLFFSLGLFSYKPFFRKAVLFLSFLCGLGLFFLLSNVVYLDDLSRNFNLFEFVIPGILSFVFVLVHLVYFNRPVVKKFFLGSKKSLKIEPKKDEPTPKETVLKIEAESVGKKQVSTSVESLDAEPNQQSEPSEKASFKESTYKKNRTFTVIIFAFFDIAIGVMGSFICFLILFPFFRDIPGVAAADLPVYAFSRITDLAALLSFVILTISAMMMMMLKNSGRILALIIAPITAVCGFFPLSKVPMLIDKSVSLGGPSWLLALVIAILIFFFNVCYLLLPNVKAKFR